MQLSDAQISRYEADGFLDLGQIFAPAEIALSRQEAAFLGSPARPLADANIYEKRNRVVRRSYSMEKDSEAFRVAYRLPRFLDLAHQLLGPHVYLLQTHMEPQGRPQGRGLAVASGLHQLVV